MSDGAEPNGGANIDIATIPTFAARWLIPRLGRFREKHPNIIVHLAERMEPFVLAGSGFDAAIHFDHPAWTGMRTHRLLQETLVPVCHPTLLGSAKVPPTLDELPRLHRRQNPDAWQRYAQEAGIVLTNPAIGPRYDLHVMLIEAALAGLGVALVPRLYVETELAEGRLVAPWPDGQSISKTFCLILPEPIRLSDGPIQDFANWLLMESRTANITI
ncbi:LysR substrate-binding domain-containing protein [Rhizobium sp. ERR 1071]|uniref:LysR substrate-binding domain-containing protein n=1 Tax=Rhizobium sp. ERR 1071 TaxID=2572677 RepID=UPI002FDEB355